jgi:aldehyde:ferredoxin oxidoreductase
MRPAPEPVYVGVLRDFEAMLDRYYRLRGWDEDGVPTPETIQRLSRSKIALAGRQSSGQNADFCPL